MKRIFVLIAILTITAFDIVMAQKNNNILSNQKAKVPSIQLLTRNYGDSIVLRWAPTKAAHWLVSTKKGFRVQRTEVTKNNPQGTSVMLTQSPLRPMTFEAVKQHYSKYDNYVGAAIQALYDTKTNSEFKADFANILKTSTEQNNRYATAMMVADYSKNAATVLGLRIVDKSPKNQEAIYVYKVWIDDTESIKGNIPKDTASVVVIPQEKSKVYAPLTAGVINGDRQITLRWYRMNIDGQFSGFFIERSEDGTFFKRLNNTPFVQSPADAEYLKRDTVSYRGIKDPSLASTFTDSIGVNYKKFYYRIVGIDAFGELSPSSDVMEGIGKDYTPPTAPKNLKIKVVDNKVAILTWEKHKQEADLKGYAIARGGSVNGPFNFVKQDLLSTQTLTFTDPDPQPYTGNYYIVGAVDTAGNVNYTLPVVANIEDRTPPSAPTNIVAKADAQGRIKIQWANNPEADVVTYKVYRSYRKENKAYTQITPDGIALAEFVDSLPVKNLLNKAIYYKIVAIDLSNNHSGYSVASQAILPDTKAPTSPIIEQIIIEKKGVKLTIIPSSSNDVSAHTIYKKEDKGTWQVFKKINGLLNSSIVVIDSAVKNNQHYYYKIEAIDYAGLKSPEAVSTPIAFVGNTSQNLINNLVGNYDVTTKAIQLKWTCEASNISHYVVYRSFNQSGLSMYETVETGRFVDKSAIQNGTFEYAVRVYFKDGTSHKLTSPIKVEVRQ